MPSLDNMLNLLIIAYNRHFIKTKLLKLIVLPSNSLLFNCSIVQTENRPVNKDTVFFNQL